MRSFNIMSPCVKLSMELLLFVCLLYCSVLAVESQENGQFNNNPFASPYDEDNKGQRMDENQFYGLLKRAGWENFKRMGNFCGNEVEPCQGRCCGRINPTCCKKGWTCRYMPRRRDFDCIP